MPVGHDGEERDITFATFYMEAQPDDKLTKANGGVPQFIDIEMVKIQIPGQRDEVCRPVQEKDKTRWAQRYEQFRKGVAQEITGVPISEFATATESERATLKAAGIYSVEQIAGLNDDATGKLHLVALKHKAQAFMKLREGLGESGKLQTRIRELEQKIKELENANAPTVVSGRTESDGVQPPVSDNVEQQPGQQEAGAARKRGRPRSVVPPQVA